MKLSLRDREYIFNMTDFNRNRYLSEIKKEN